MNNLKCYNKVNISNNFLNGKKIVSFDNNKTWVIEKEDKFVFCKKTNKSEDNTIKKISKILNESKILINDKEYFLYIPKVYNWDNNNKILYMQFCHGKNLEFILRDEKTHKLGCTILNEVLNFFIVNKIFWVDFAPRNILINNNKIILVDFEKGLSPKNTKVYDYLRNHVYEEYCLFLFENERIYSDDFVFKIRKSEENEIYNISEIKSIRIKEMAIKLGYNKQITNTEYIEILKIFILVEKPKIIDGSFYFPGVYLDNIITDNNNLYINKYISKVLELYNKIDNNYKNM